MWTGCSVLCGLCLLFSGVLEGVCMHTSMPVVTFLEDGCSTSY